MSAGRVETEARKEMKMHRAGSEDFMSDPQRIFGG